MGKGRYHNIYGDCNLTLVNGNIKILQERDFYGLAAIKDSKYIDAMWCDGSAGGIKYIYGKGKFAFFSGVGIYENESCPQKYFVDILKWLLIR